MENELKVKSNDETTKKDSCLSAVQQSGIISKRFKNEYCNNYSLFIVKSFANKQTILHDSDWLYSVIVSNCQASV